jgi:hypothetical protein
MSGYFVEFLGIEMKLVIAMLSADSRADRVAEQHLQKAGMSHPLADSILTLFCKN